MNVIDYRTSFFINIQCFFFININCHNWVLWRSLKNSNSPVPEHQKEETKGRDFEFCGSLLLFSVWVCEWERNQSKGSFLSKQTLSFLPQISHPGTFIVLFLLSLTFPSLLNTFIYFLFPFGTLSSALKPF